MPVPYDPAVNLTTVLLLVACVAALVDWWAVAVDRHTVRPVAKPLTMALLVAVAATIGDAPADVRTWLLIGAVLGLVGDVALLGDGELAFMAGLAAFAIGHLAYAVAALSVGFDWAWAIPGAVFLAALLGFRFIGRILPGAHHHGGAVLAGAVGFYAIVISATVVTAWATGEWIAAGGAMLFAVSDWLLGYQRFVSPIRRGHLAVMIPYHVGQALLIIGLSTA